MYSDYQMRLNIQDFSQPPKDIVEAYRHALFHQREVPMAGAPYIMEQQLLHFVRTGDLPALQEHLKKMSNAPSRVGSMSSNPLRQAQYVLVSGLTLITRAAIAGGMPESDAYNLSDIYIQKADICRRDVDVTKLFLVALHDFTRRVHNVKINHPQNYIISQCLNYILEHLHYKITLVELSKFCKVSPPYLSGLFHQEMGCTIHNYILHEKLDISAEMLTNSSFSVSEIADYLSFASASAYGQYFKKQFGVTPGYYRNVNSLLATKNNSEYY